MDENESVSDVVVEHQRTRQLRRKHHLENVQLSIAALIIGSYFTEIGQELASLNSVGWLTDYFVGISAAFVVLKTTELTARQFRDTRFLNITGALLYTLYTVSAVGYAALLGASIFGINLTDLGSDLFVVGLSIFGLIVAMLFYVRNVVNFSRYVPGLNEGRVVSYIAQFLEDFVLENPKTIEEGLELEVSYPADEKVDAMMVDEDGNSVAVEIKYRMGALSLYDIGQTLAEVEADRVVVAVNAQADLVGKEDVEEDGVEVIEIDPYAVFGRFSGLVEFFDRRFNYLGFRELGLA